MQSRRIELHCKRSTDIHSRINRTTFQFKNVGTDQQSTYIHSRIHQKPHHTQILAPYSQSLHFYPRFDLSTHSIGELNLEPYQHNTFPPTIILTATKMAFVADNDPLIKHESMIFSISLLQLCIKIVMSLQSVEQINSLPIPEPKSILKSIERCSVSLPVFRQTFRDKRHDRKCQNDGQRCTHFRYHT